MRVVVADDSVLLREGIVRLLKEAGFETVGAVGDATTLLAEVGRTRPNVAVIDVRMPPTHTDEGLVAAEEIRRQWPGVGVLILSAYVEVALAGRLLQSGADGLGYLLKDRITDVADFAAAVRRVGGGGSAIDPAVVSELLARHRNQSELERLTSREREVLALMAEGLSNSAVAARLVISSRAVEKHVTHIFDRLGLSASEGTHRRVRAVLTYLQG